MKAISLSIVAMMTAVGVANAADITGSWSRSDGNARVKISKCGADICATNTWIRPGTPSEKKGDVLVMKIKPVSATDYKGSAYDKQRDMSYRMSLSIKGDKMTTKGCVLGGLLCKGVQWTRIR